jgi:ectoine hydroxylase-related dioxygenase (phytanoyl-CoA dioxygenase family)
VRPSTAAPDSPELSPERWLAHRLTPAERDQFEADGYVLVPDVLDGDEIEALTEGVDAVHRRFLAGGGDPLGECAWDDCLAEGGPFVDLIDHPRTLPKVWGLLGWNICVYHTQLNVKPPSGKPPRTTTFAYHQDSGRVNREVETDPPARLSLKVGYYLTDVLEEGYGNTWLVPGSHLRKRLQLPADGSGQPEGAIPILAPAGTAIVFDRRIWHAGTRNWSPVTRRVVFYGYAYRWMHAKDDMALDPASAGPSPIRRQLLGDGTPRSRYSPADDEVPLRRWLLEHSPAEA